MEFANSQIESYGLDIINFKNISCFHKMSVTQLNYTLRSSIDLDMFHISIISAYDQLLDAKCTVNVIVDDKQLAEAVQMIKDKLSPVVIVINSSKAGQSVDVPAGCLFFGNVLASLEAGIKSAKESKLYEVATPESAAQMYETMSTTLTVPTKILGFESSETLQAERIPAIMKMIYSNLLPLMTSVEETMKEILERVEKQSGETQVVQEVTEIVE